MNSQYDISRYVQPINNQKTQQKQQSMEMLYFVLMIVGVIVIFAIISRYNTTSKMSSMVVSTPPPAPEDPLTANGWEVIVSDSCPYCIKQKEILAQHFPTFKNIFNNKPTNVVPTWRNTKTGQEIPGMLSYETLLQLR